MENTDSIKAFLSVIRPYYCKICRVITGQSKTSIPMERNDIDNVATLAVKESLKYPSVFYFRPERYTPNKRLN